MGFLIQNSPLCGPEQVFILSAPKGEPISTSATPRDAHKKDLRMPLHLPLARDRVRPAHLGTEKVTCL